ncbi:MAG: hypothetical protein WDZ91_11855 [Paenibacillaceae bacterium]
MADRLPQEQYQIIADKLNIFVDNCVVKNPEDRKGYSAAPLLLSERMSVKNGYFEQN